jgi:hypothetical protein
VVLEEQQIPRRADALLWMTTRGGEGRVNLFVGWLRSVGLAVDGASAWEQQIPRRAGALLWMTRGAEERIHRFVGRPRSVF